MAKCPKDADGAIELIMCNKRSPGGYFCTRKKGHKGKHHAHAEKGHCCKTWA